MAASETASTAHPLVDGPTLRSVLGHFPTGVTVVSYRRDEGVHGATVNAFTSVSLDPPLVLVALDRRSRTAGLLADGPFAVNFLAEDQDDVAMHFAGRPRDEPIEWSTDAGGCPVLAGTVGHLACRPWSVHDGGDHVLHLGAVEQARIHSTRPLLFHRGSFPRIESPPDESPWFGSLDGPAPLHHAAAPHERTAATS